MREEQQQEERTVTLRDCSLADSTRSIQSANWSNLCLRDLVCSRAWMRGWYAGRSLIDGRDLIAFHWKESPPPPSDVSDGPRSMGRVLPGGGSCHEREGGRLGSPEAKESDDEEHVAFLEVRRDLAQLFKRVWCAPVKLQSCLVVRNTRLFRKLVRIGLDLSPVPEPG